MRNGPPILVFLIGPAAVGKMTVGAALAARTGLKLFHNHQTIDLVLPYFAFGSPPFDRLVTQFRRRIFEEIAESDLPGLVFTYVWAFDQPADQVDVEQYASVFLERGGSVYYVELQASQQIRLERNATPYRLERKPFKRDIEASRRDLISMDENYQLDSRGRFAHRKDWLRVDNSELSPEDVAEVVIAHFALPTVSPKVVI